MVEKSIPYIVHEDILVRQERTIKRLWIMSLLLAGGLAAVGGWAVWEKNR